MILPPFEEFNNFESQQNMMMDQTYQAMRMFGNAGYSHFENSSCNRGPFTTQAKDALS